MFKVFIVMNAGRKMHGLYNVEAVRLRGRPTKICSDEVVENDCMSHPTAIFHIGEPCKKRLNRSRCR